MHLKSNDEWIEGYWSNGEPVLEPLEKQPYIWIYVKGSNHSLLIPYKGLPDFFLGTQYYAYYHYQEKEREPLRWWWRPLSSPEIPKVPND